MSFEHLLVLGIVLLIFGPKRLPELGNTLGKFIRNFKDSVSGVEEAAFRKINEAGDKPSNNPNAAPITQAQGGAPQSETKTAETSTQDPTSKTS